MPKDHIKAFFIAIPVVAFLCLVAQIIVGLD